MNARCMTSFQRVSDHAERCAMFIASPAVSKVLIVFWGLMFFPTVLVWKQSILWLAIMSWYAIWRNEIVGWVQAKMKEAADAIAEEASDA